MATVDEEPPQPNAVEQRQPITQLEFRQAMRDFKTMFPEMDEDVIEVVLRSNNGSVDSTIDQLLAMSTDNENERLRTELDATENDELPPRYSPSTPPPSYNQAVPCFTNSPKGGATGGSAEVSAGAKGQPGKSKVQFNVPESSTLGQLPDVTQNGTAAAEHSERTDIALRMQRAWKPPLLGELPPHFLKISGYQSKPKQKVSVLSSSLLQQRLAENERLRLGVACAGDAGVSQQLLEDERIALFLQNEEFYRELKDNKDFLNTLERAISEVSTPEEEVEQVEPTEELDSSFPYPNNTAPEETDAAFREKIKNMGKVSRKKFTQLAKLFSRKKRRPFKPILGDGSNPSRDNLLLHEDEYSENSEEEDEGESSKKDTWNSHVGGPGGQSQTIERSKLDL